MNPDKNNPPEDPLVTPAAAPPAPASVLSDTPMPPLAERAPEPNTPSPRAQSQPSPTPPTAPPKKTPDSLLSDIQPAPPGPSLKSKLVPESIRGFFSTLVFIASVLVVATLINSFIFQSYYVDGTSMEPTLQNNDRLIIDKTAHTVADIKQDPYIPERGEIVVLDSSIIGVNGQHEQLIKRVIGLPGETITITDGVVTIKNKASPKGFKADQFLALKLSPTFTDDPIDVTLGENELFVMGDNRAPGGSFDSREFGPIKASQIEGRLVIRVFPFNRITIF